MMQIRVGSLLVNEILADKMVGSIYIMLTSKLVVRQNISKQDGWQIKCQSARMVGRCNVIQQGWSNYQMKYWSTKWVVDQFGRFNIKSQDGWQIKYQLAGWLVDEILFSKRVGI